VGKKQNANSNPIFPYLQSIHSVNTRQFIAKDEQGKTQTLPILGTLTIQKTQIVEP